VLIVPLAYSETQVGTPKDMSSALRAFLMNAFLSSDFIFWIMSKLARKKMFSTILGTPPADVEKAGAEEYTHLTEFLAHIEPISRRKRGLQNEETIAKSLTRYELEQITVPTLIVGIENCLYKTFPGARYTAQHIPGARFVTYPTGGHMAVGHQTEVWSEVKEFVSQHRIDANGDSVKTGAPASPPEPR